MEITFSNCDSILRTLPIGYYAGKDIPVHLDKTAETSYYNLIRKEITISFPIIAHACDNIVIDDIPKKEETVRGMLYHELSHAILTPIAFPESIKRVLEDAYYANVPQDIFNIFEDERIEVLLRNYYLNVNFTELVYNVNGGFHASTDSVSKFYNVVRFRKETNPNWDSKVNEIIERFSEINSSTTDYYCDLYSYITDIIDLYREIDRNNNQNQQNRQQKQNGSGEESDNNSDSDSNAQESADTNTDMSNTQKAKDSISKIDKYKIKQLVNDSLHPEAMGNKKKMIPEVEKVVSTLEQAIKSFNRKTGEGNGMMGYHGVLNPKNFAVRDNNYRYFDRKVEVNGMNKFGKVHLNLFIDESGSFQCNEKVANFLLQGLYGLTKRYPNFALSVVYMGTHTHEPSSRNMALICSGGNNLMYDEVKPIFSKLQWSGYANHNLVLFDGDAFSYSSQSAESENRAMQVFNKPNTTVISDYENREYLNRFTAGKVIITTNYVDEFIKEIQKIIPRMFR